MISSQPEAPAGRDEAAHPVDSGLLVPKNYLAVWNVGGAAVRDYHFALAYWNSLKIAFINLTGSVLTSTLAGYAFAKIKSAAPRRFSSCIWPR